MVLAGLYRTSKLPSLPLKQTLLSSLNTIEHHSILKVTLSWHHRRYAWFYCGKRRGLSKGIRVPNGVADKTVPNGTWWHSWCHICSDLRSLPLALTIQCIYLDVHLYYVAVQNLVYGFGNVQLTTVDNFETPLKHQANVCGNFWIWPSTLLWLTMAVIEW